MFTEPSLRARADFKNDINWCMINIIQKLIKLRQSIYRTEIIPLRSSNKSKVLQNQLFKKFDCLNLDRTVVSLI